jgi:catechol 2,3-dioxygenase-like lactoylglutathione lyase family enzyme
MTGSTFRYQGVNHVALVCRDMKETVDFYTKVLEMKLVKTLDLPGGSGQHFFFDAGNGALIAFFWFPDAPEAAPGIASQNQTPGKPITTAHASMNHLAMDIPLEDFDAYVERLKSKGLKVRVINHADNDRGYTEGVTDETWIRSMYFTDPNGIALELAALTRPFNEGDVAHAPATYEDRHRYLKERAAARNGAR